MTNLIVSNLKQAEEDAIFSKIIKFINNNESFVFDAGAGAGKTYCLVQSLKYILSEYSSKLKTHNQQIRCITYTNIAAKEIKKRLGHTELVTVSTIHDFLWEQINSYQEELLDIHKEKLKKTISIKKQELENEQWAQFYRDIEDKGRFNNLIYENEEIYYKNKNSLSSVFKNAMSMFENKYLNNVANFKKVVDNVLLIHEFNKAIDNIDKKIKKNSHGIDYTKVSYNSLISYDRLEKMQFSHDTLLEYSIQLIRKFDILKRVISDKYPYILVDEYQDTSPNVIELLATLSKYTDNDLIIGYYGDKKQNIYENGVGDAIYKLHSNINKVKKEFNRRSAKRIIEVGTLIRNDDLKQKTIYENCPEGKVSFYVGKNIDAFIKYHHEKWNINSNNKLDCLLLKNEDIAHRTKFGEIYDFFKNAPFYTRGRNYTYLRDHLLSKEIEKLGKVQSLIYHLLDFKHKIKNPDTLIQNLVKDNILKCLTIDELRELISKLQAINGDTFNNYCISIFNMLKSRNRNVVDVLTSYIIEDNIKNVEQLFSYILNTLFYISNENFEYEKNNSKIDNFLKLDISIFDNWYNYINNNILSDTLFHTYHGTKGEEFDNVLIVMDKGFGRTQPNFFSDLIENLSSTENTKINLARNLLYVAVTRARSNLSILYTDVLNQKQKNQIQNIFGEINETQFF